MSNTVPSDKITDLKANAESVDQFVNSNNTATTTRTGKQVRTLAGINVDFDAMQSGELTAQAINAAKQAQSAEDGAVSAAEVAMAAGWIYESASDGVIARVDGDYFWVVSGIQAEILELFRRVSGAAVSQGKSLPSNEYLKNTIPGDNLRGVSFGVEDINGNVNWFIDEQGVPNQNKSIFDTDEQFHANLQGYAWGVQDASGNVSIGLNDNGVFKGCELSFERAKTKFLNGSLSSSVINSSTPTENITLDAEINGLASYGQSLSIGADALPLQSKKQRYDNLMFLSVRTQDAGNDPAVVYASLNPLIESVNGSLGETPVSGATDIIKELLSFENGINVNNSGYQILGSAPGSGGTPIEGLNKGTSFYSRLLQNAEYGKVRALEQDKRYIYQATTWMQGEADYSASTSGSSYRLTLNQMVADIKTDIKLTTGQSKEPQFISYQVGSHLRYAKSVGVASAFDAEIAKAQLACATVDNTITMACPMYQFDYAGSVDEVHLTSYSSKIVGGYFGLAYKRKVIDGRDFKPLYPLSLTKSGQSLYLKLNVPQGPLVIDTDWVTQNTNYGFRAFNGSTELTISDVKIISNDTIKITITEDISAVICTVDYALFSDDVNGEVGRTNGARGNIRDSQGESIAFDNFPLHNWLVMFDIME